jgi:RNA polymerase sigma factor (sigma-70 family)
MLPAIFLKDLNEIIDLCKKDDPRGRELLFKVYAKPLFGLCRRYLSDTNDAEDVLHDSFIRIFLKIKDYSGTGSFEGWMKKVTVNCALSFLKQQRKVKFESIADTLETEQPDEEERIRSDMSPGEILECLHELPEGYRTVLNLYLMEGFSHKEISVALGIKETTSRTQYMKARRALITIINERTKSNKSQWITMTAIASLLKAS